MENLLLNSAKGFFNDEILHLLSSNTGENPDNVKKGLDAIIPAVLLGLQSQGQSGLSGILDKAKHLFNFGNFNINSFFESDDSSKEGTASHDLLGSIFGTGALTGIVSSLSGFFGIKGDSITKLLGVSLPAVFSSITNKGTNWDASSISSLLDSNKDSLLSALPSGLGLASLGLGSLSGLGKGAKDLVDSATKTISKAAHEIPTATQVKHVIEKEKKGGGLWWLLIPLILIAAWLLFGKGCGSADKPVADTTVHVNTVDTSSLTATAPSRENVSLKLPNGQDLSAWTGGIEDQLIKFLQSGDYKNLSEADLKDKWFDFDNLNFETGTATILPESRPQLANIAAILKAFPDVKLKIGGYTDKTGNEAVNKKISNERAESVKKYLTEQGLAAQVAGAEGYGSEFAKYEASAPESDRIKDRRVSISIRK